MSLIAWNCQGLRRPTASRSMRTLVREVDPWGIFLMDTKINYNKLGLILRSLGFFLFISTPPVGCKGGLAFCWRPGL